MECNSCKIKGFVQRNLLTLIGVAAGMVGGYLYWRFVGCSSGSCPITSSPVITALWGAVFGDLLLSMFKVRRNELPECKAAPGEKTPGKDENNG